MLDHQLLLLTRRQLMNWGSWSKRLTALGLGYANQSLLARLQQQGGMIVRSTAKPRLPKNPEAESMNDWIEKLAEDKPRGYAKPHWAEIVRIHYTMNDRPYASRVQIAKLSRRTYDYYLREAEIWLSQSLLRQH